MNPIVSRRTGGFPSPFRHPRFIIGSSALAALLTLEFAALLAGGLT